VQIVVKRLKSLLSQMEIGLFIAGTVIKNIVPEDFN
jgi:hypothetical protein